MAFFRQIQLRRTRFGYFWRIWWGEATFITHPGSYPDKDGTWRSCCQGWALTRSRAVKNSEKHLERHLHPNKKYYDWTTIK